MTFTMPHTRGGYGQDGCRTSGRVPPHATWSFERHSSPSRSPGGIMKPRNDIRVTKREQRRSVRRLLEELVGEHTSDIKMKLRDGMLHKKAGTALRYLQMAAAYVDGKPTETHVNLDVTEGLADYDLTQLDASERKTLLILLQKAKKPIDKDEE